MTTTTNAEAYLTEARRRALADMEWRALVELYDAKALRVAELEARNAEQERAAKARIAQLEAALRAAKIASHCESAAPCPLTLEPGERGDLGDACTCGVAQHNAAIDRALAGVPPAPYPLRIAEAVRDAARRHVQDYADAMYEDGRPWQLDGIDDAIRALDIAAIIAKVTGWTVVQVSVGPDPRDLPAVDPP